jgi:hypothetical protein
LVVPLLQKNMVLWWWMARVDLYKVFNTKKPLKARFALLLKAYAFVSAIPVSTRLIPKPT